jgi:glycopeptide antibiotics resistance protein
MKKIINYIPSGFFSVIATAFVVYVLLVPSSSLPQSWLGLFSFKYGDKVLHLLLFFFLCLAYLYDYTKARTHHTKLNKELAFTTLAGSIGLLTEAGQLALGIGRDFDVTDIVFDVVGAFLAFALMHWGGSHVLRKYVFDVHRKRGRKKHHRHHHHHHHHDDED